MTCSTCPRPTDGAAQCDRCLLRRAQQLHRTPLPAPRLALHAEEQREAEDRKARAALLAREQRPAYTPKPRKPRKLGAPRAYKGRLSVGESEGGWVVVDVLGDGVYRVRCPYCVTETNKNRTTMKMHRACSSCARRQGKRGAVQDGN